MESEFRAINRYKLPTEWRNDVIIHKARRSQMEERWQRRGCIGQGGFGTVWLEVKQDETNKTRAVKEVKKAAGTNHNLDYQRELLALVDLAAPTFRDIFVEFYGWYQDKNFVYYAMEYFSLGDLDQYLSRGIHEDEASQITNQILDGLSIMHENSFTHRDLKPKNIFVVRKQPWWVKIGDFGISKRVDDSTALHTTVFSTGYAAPELESSDDPSRGENYEYTNAVDVWSLGCVAYKMLTGEVPFSSRPGRSMSEFCHNRAPFPIEPLIAKSVSHSAVKFVQALIKALPSDRLAVRDALASSWIQAQNDLPGLKKQRQTSSEPPSTPRVSSEVSLISSSTNSPENEENLILGPLGSTSVDQFLAAAASGNNAAIEILRNRRVDVNIESFDGRTPLHEAAAQGQNSTLKLLLQIPGVYKDARDNEQNTPMLAAACAANFESVQILLEHGANPRVRNDSGTSALHEAATYNKEALVRTLIQQGIPTSLERGGSGMTPLHCAARNGSFEAMKVLLEEYGARTDLKDNTGSTALHVAVRFHKIDCVLLLVQQKTCTELKESKRKHTPLHTAIDCNFEEVTLILLRNGADPNAKDEAQWGALHMAIRSHQIGIGRQLVESGADIELHGGPDGLTSLQLAILAGSKDFIELLLDRGAAFTIWDKKRKRHVRFSSLIAARWQYFLILTRFLKHLEELVELGNQLISDCRKTDGSGNLTQLIGLLECFMKIIHAWSSDMHKIEILDFELSKGVMSQTLVSLNSESLKCAEVFSKIKKSLDASAGRGATRGNPKSRLIFESWGKSWGRSWEKSAAKSIMKETHRLHLLQGRLLRLNVVSAMTRDLFDGMEPLM